MTDQFVSEAIEPVGASFATADMARGEPGLPQRFRWRGREYAVEDVMDQWKESGPCHSGANEMYLRKHWYRLRTDDGTVMNIYFQRQAKRGTKGARSPRWWLYTITR